MSVQAFQIPHNLLKDIRFYFVWFDLQLCDISSLSIILFDYIIDSMIDGKPLMQGIMKYEV